MKEPTPGKYVAFARPICAAGCMLPCFLWLGCLAAPVRVPTHTVGQSGQHDRVELGFLHVGSTRRAEVIQQLGWTDTQFTNERLFLGRWMESKWAVAAAVAGGGGSADRLWQVHSLIVEFDEKGIVTAYRVVADADLAKELSASLARTETPALDLSTALTVSLRHHHGLKSSENYGSGILSLGREMVEFSEPGKLSHGFKISPRKITGLTFAGRMRGDNPDYRNTNYTLHFSAERNAGKSLTMRIDMPTLIVLARYLAQNDALARNR